MALELEKILGTDTGKEAFYKSDRNFDRIKDAMENVSGDAVDINYDNEESELEAENVQDAVDELKEQINSLDADKVDNSRVLTNVPVNAKFTDTITTINGKTGAISKADIVALGIPSQDTTYSIATTSANGLMSSTDKQNLEANTTSRHTHINKAVIDKFSEVDNKLYYDGAEIGGSIVDLGTFNNEEALITHVVMNQLPTGHYTFTMYGFPYFMLLGDMGSDYKGVLQDSEGTHRFFQVKKTGQIIHLFELNVRDEIVDLQDFKADITYVDNKVQTDVPSDAKFTDTITTINGKTGTITKADIVALGIPAQDTNTTYSEISTSEIDAGTSSTLRTITGRRLKYLLDKIVALFPTKVSELTNDSGFLTSVTKSDVGLSNVDNVKQMPISGGVLENYREKLVTLSGTATTINLSLGNVFTHSLTGNTTYTISNAVSGQAHSFTLIINMGSTVRTLTFPSSVKWQGGEIPDMSTASKTYVLTFLTINGGTTWLGMFGGEF